MALVRNKEDTARVFHIYDALPSRHFWPHAHKLALSEHGQSLREREPFLPPVLDDHEALRNLPEGSVGQAYCHFMEEEGLTASGLVQAAEEMGRPKYGDLIEWYGWRQRDTHDLLHVLTGYGRDALGEACNLLFTHGHAPSHAHLLLGYSAAINIRRKVKTRAPVLKAVREAHRSGASVPAPASFHIGDLLRMNIDEARQMLGIERPHAYHACHEVWQDERIDPYDLLAAAA